MAARGSNEVRNLLIYNQKKNLLTLLKNSECYPNMMYNEKLDCIDAFLLHGGSRTVFLKIKADSLQEFASVNLDDQINICVIDRYGKKRYLVRNKRSNFDPHTWFKNFRPLEVY